MQDYVANLLNIYIEQVNRGMQAKVRLAALVECQFENGTPCPQGHQNNEVNERVNWN